MAVSKSYCLIVDEKVFLYIPHKKTNGTEKHQYKRDLIQSSFIVHILRNGH